MTTRPTTAAAPSSREAILGRIRAAHPEPVEHPGVKMYRIAGDPVANFTAKLHAADGRVERFGSRAEALAWLAENIPADSRTVFSAVDGYEGNLPLSAIADPHAANVIDICVAEGELGVGETGSIWVTGESLKSAAAALFSTDLYLLLDTRQIVDGIHAAYDRIDLAAHQYGAFYTGPSATADIEAVHITGAQGEISLTALLY